MTVRAHGVWILLATVLGAAGAYGVSRLVPGTYRAQAVVLVEARPRAGGTPPAPAMGTERDLASSPAVFRPAAGRIGADPETLAAGLTVSVTPGSDVLTIRYDNADRERARARAQALAEAYVDYRNAGAAPTVAATLLGPADAPGEPLTWPLWLVLAIGALAGLVVGAGTARVRVRRADRLGSRAAVERLTGLTVLATVPRTGRPRGPGAARPVLLRAPQTPAAESYRYLRSRLRPLLPADGSRDGAVAVLVASAREGEGRSTTAANLAVAFAQAGRSVILVDADLRRPRLHTVFEVSGERGLTTVLAGAGVVESLRETSVPRLRLLPAGPGTVESTDPVDGPLPATVIRALRRDCDVLVIDSPPLLSVADGIGLAALADRVLLVGDHRRSTRAALVRALEELGEVADGTISAVLVNLPARAGGLVPRRRTAAVADEPDTGDDRFASLAGPSDGVAPMPKPGPASTVYTSKAATPGDTTG